MVICFCDYCLEIIDYYFYYVDDDKYCIECINFLYTPSELSYLEETHPNRFYWKKL